MKFAFLSDIHANLQAWKAILLDIRSNGVDQIICLGDIVGYGPNPSETLQSAYGNINHFVLGNHDAAACGRINPSMFNDRARSIVEWTKTQLNSHAIDFLNTLPLSLKSELFRCAHSDFLDPSAFNYIIDIDDAAPSWHSTAEQLLFVGHTHEPAIFVLDEDNTTYRAELCDFILEQNRRYLVNVGSVGQPRDGDTRACYCIFDSNQKTIHWRRIPFDIEGYIDALRSANLPAQNDFLLKHDPRHCTKPLREMLDFSPASNDNETARGAIEVQDISELQKSVSKLRRICILLTTAGIVSFIATLAFFLFLKIRPLNKTYDGAEIHHNSDKNMVISAWHIHLDNRWQQSLETEIDPRDLTPVLIVSNSRKRNGLNISTPELPCSEGTKFSIEALFLKDKMFEGNIYLAADISKEQNGKKEVLEKYVLKEPNLQRKEGWMQAKHTFTVPAGTSGITFRITGAFKGRVKIRDISLTRK